MERNIDNTLVLDKGSKRTFSPPFNSEQVQVNQEERRLPDGEEGSDYNSVASEEVVAANMMDDLEKQWPKVSPPSSPKQNEFLTGLM